MNSTKDLTSALINPTSSNNTKSERSSSQAISNNSQQEFSAALARQKEKRINDAQQAKSAKPESGNNIKKEEKTKNTETAQETDQEKMADSKENSTVNTNSNINPLNNIAPIGNDQAFISADTQATKTLVVDTKVDPNAKISDSDASGNNSVIDPSYLPSTRQPVNQNIAQPLLATTNTNEASFKDNALQKSKNLTFNINQQQNINTDTLEKTALANAPATQTVNVENPTETIKSITSQHMIFDQAEQNQQQLESNNNVVPLADKNLMQSLHLSNNHQNTYQAQIQAPLGSQRFAEETAQQLQFAIGKQAQFAELKITPADMGPISIKIDMQGNQANLQFIVTQADTKQAIEDALPKLRELFAQAGLQLNGSDVNQQSQQQQQQNAYPKWQNSMQLNELTSVDTGLTPQRYTVKGMLDIFA